MLAGLKMIKESSVLLKKMLVASVAQSVRSNTYCLVQTQHERFAGFCGFCFMAPLLPGKPEFSIE